MDKVNYNFHDFDFFEGLNFKFNLKISSNPKVSIIIPVYNQILYTLNCLWSLKTEFECIDSEIIIINDNSTDNTLELLEKIEGLKIINNRQNLGFLKNINLGIQSSVGEYILLLNNDVIVFPNLLQELLSTFSKFNNVGAVGSKAMHPTNIILEAGSVIFKNGVTTNLGRGHKPDSPFDQSLKLVDYCSGYCLLLKRFFPDQTLVQLDEKFLPAYYEETDLCITLKHKFKKHIIYNPFAELVHFESISYTAEKNDKKAVLLKKNRFEFLAKWKKELEQYLPETRYSYHSLAKNYLTVGKVYLSDKISDSLVNSLIKNHDIASRQVFLVLKKELDAKLMERLRRIGVEVVYPHLNSKNKPISYFKLIKQFAKTKNLIITSNLFYKLVISIVRLKR